MNRSRLRKQITWCNRLANKDKGSYCTNLITANCDDPKKLWQSLTKVLHRTSETVLLAHSSEKSLVDTFASFVCKIIRLHPHIKFHFYADDTQLHIYLSNKNASAALAKLNACLHNVQRWMSLSKLKLNPEKPEFIVFGSKAQRQKISSHFPVSILGSLLHPVDSVRNLGVWFDAEFPSLNMSRGLAQRAFFRCATFVEYSNLIYCCASAISSPQ